MLTSTLGHRWEIWLLTGTLLIPPGHHANSTPTPAPSVNRD